METTRRNFLSAAGAAAGTLALAGQARASSDGPIKIGVIGMGWYGMVDAKSTAMVQLGMIAYETGSVVEWDEASEQIVGNAQASKLLLRDYRTPYEHPYPYKG